MGGEATAPVAVGPARVVGVAVPVRRFRSSGSGPVHLVHVSASSCVWSTRDRNAPGFLRFRLLCRLCGPGEVRAASYPGWGELHGGVRAARSWRRPEPGARAQRL